MLYPDDFTAMAVLVKKDPALQQGLFLYTIELLQVISFR